MMHHTLAFNTQGFAPIIIFGLGHTGFSCVRYCQRMGIPICVVDTRLEPPYLSDLKKFFPQVECFLGDNLPIEVILQKAQQIMVSPGVDIAKQSLLQEAKHRKIDLIGDIELFARACKKPYIAITGSNGKTTVTTLVGELLKTLGLRVGVGGNIGTPALDLLEISNEISNEIPTETSKALKLKTENQTALSTPWDVYVLELSSFQLETTYSLAPTVATILNITPDHLDRYAIYDDYVRAKQKIIENALHIVPSQAYIQNQKTPCFAIRSIENQDCLVFLDAQHKVQILCTMKDIPLLGIHNYLNILSALTLVQVFAQALNLNWQDHLQKMVLFLTQFKGLAHRCQWIRSHAGVRWVNDSKGTNIGASLAALQSMAQVIEKPSQIILIAGGEGKNQDFTQLKVGLDAIENSLRHIILMGKDAKLIQEALSIRPNTNYQLTIVNTLKEAVCLAAQLAKQGDMVLLSPSCSSLDQYPNYMARGEDFMQAVGALQ